MKQNAQVHFKRQRILKALELALAGRKITDPSDRVSEKKVLSVGACTNV